VERVIKPVHIAALGFVGAVIAIAAMVLATSTTGDQASTNRSALLVTATFVRNQLYDEVASATTTPMPEVIEATPQSTQLLAPAPPPPPAATVETAALRSCDEIRDTGTYVSDAERDFFLEECTDEAEEAAAPSGPASTPRPTAATVEAERAYRVKAESIANSYLTVLHGYTPARLRESSAAVSDFGARAGGWANQLENFAPVPPRYLVAHQRLQTALWELAAHTRLVANGQANIEDEAYQTQLNRLIDSLNAAIDAYFNVLGVPEPEA
jgi:hypothetical protein